MSKPVSKPISASSNIVEKKPTAIKNNSTDVKKRPALNSKIKKPPSAGRFITFYTLKKCAN